jgi:hypothetical protein
LVGFPITDREKRGSNEGHLPFNVRYLCVVVGCHLRRKVFEFAVSHEPHNPKVGGSNPPPATKNSFLSASSANPATIPIDKLFRPEFLNLVTCADGSEIFSGFARDRSRLNQHASPVLLGSTSGLRVIRGYRQLLCDWAGSLRFPGKGRTAY